MAKAVKAVTTFLEKPPMNCSRLVELAVLKESLDISARELPDIGLAPRALLLKAISAAEPAPPLPSETMSIEAWLSTVRSHTITRVVDCRPNR